MSKSGVAIHRPFVEQFGRQTPRKEINQTPVIWKVEEQRQQRLCGVFWGFGEAWRMRPRDAAK